MESNLTKQDLARIEAIEKYLSELHTNFPALVSPFIAPIEQVEQPKSIVKEEVKERWQPSYGCKYWYIGINDGQFFIADFHWGNDDVDFVNHDIGNCFKTKEEAQSAADKIKAFLQTL